MLLFLKPTFSYGPKIKPWGPFYRGFNVGLEGGLPLAPEVESRLGLSLLRLLVRAQEGGVGGRVRSTRA